MAANALVKSDAPVSIQENNREAGAAGLLSESFSGLGKIVRMAAAVSAIGVFDGQAGQIIAKWDQYQDPGCVLRLWVGDAERNFSRYFEVNPAFDSVVIGNLKAGQTYSFTMTAYHLTTKQQSETSNIIQWTEVGSEYPRPVPRSLPVIGFNIDDPLPVETISYPVIDRTPINWSCKLEMEDNTPTVVIHGRRGAGFTIESSEDLNGAWTKVYQGTMPTDITHFTDVSDAAKVTRAKFYRVVGEAE